MLAVIKRVMSGKGDDAAALQEQITSLKAEGAEASAEIDRLKAERASAASYDEARDLDDRIGRQIWICEHVSAAIPELELQLAAVRAATQARSLAKYKGSLIDLYPKLKKAILAAVSVQHEAMALREAACRELGEALVMKNLPTIAYAGFLLPDLVSIWTAENDRVFADLARQPKPAALPVPVRAALPAPAKPPQVISSSPPAPRVARQPYRDTAPGEGETLLQILRSGLELDDGRQCAVGDVVRVSTDKAGLLLRSGAAEAVKESANG
jgi:hypothetical protein